MGVPVFFRWLTRKYPKVIQPAVCEAGFLISEVDRKKWPKRYLKDAVGGEYTESGEEIEFIDTSQANPNGVEFDNLYLDMNGIIHPCCHPESGVVPETEDEMIRNIFKCVDHLFAIVRPRKVLYLAVDGVAPRAKMNQQRARRFSTARDARIKVEADRIVREECIREGRPPPPPLKTRWDSNVITPGTPFMEKVMDGLRYYVNDRLTYDPGWKGIKVVLSTSGVPGEGEHKLMEYIRKERASPGYDPNTRHCICGLDADLIMLSLASHEVHFSILRDVIYKNEACGRCGAHGHTTDNCPTTAAIGKELEENAELTKITGAPQRKEYQFLHTYIMREYLGQYFGDMRLPFTYDFERIVDDYVFICYFVGNDFLPHLPTLDINEGAIDTLMRIYREILPGLGGYITESGSINITRVLQLLRRLSGIEDNILRRRRMREKERIARTRVRERLLKEQNKGADGPPPIKAIRLDGTDNTTTTSSGGDDNNNNNSNSSNISSDTSNSKLGLSVEEEIKQKQESLAREMGLVDKLVVDEEGSDAVRLGEEGWRDRYYKVKFNIPEGDTSAKSHAFQQHLCESYMQGLAWVLKYYYQGCPSWEWYYPYHYAPFACDLVKYIDPKTFRADDIPRGEPFRPFDQLMAVLPAASSGCLPPALGALMRDPESPIHDFYPEKFEIDLNGKRYAHQGVVILPFIDQTRLLAAIDAHLDGLTPDERRRNVRIGPTLLYVRSDHPIAHAFAEAEAAFDARSPADPADGDNYDVIRKFAVKIDPVESSGMNGSVFPAETRYRHKAGTPYQAPLQGLPKIPVSVACCATFNYPEYRPGFVFRSCLLRGVRMPEKVLAEGEAFHPQGEHHSQNNAEVRALNYLTSYDSGSYRRGPASRYQVKVRSNESMLDGESDRSASRGHNSYYSSSSSSRDKDRDRDRDRHSHGHSHSHSHSHSRDYDSGGGSSSSSSSRYSRDRDYDRDHRDHRYHDHHHDYSRDDYHDSHRKTYNYQQPAPMPYYQQQQQQQPPQPPYPGYQQYSYPPQQQPQMPYQPQSQQQQQPMGYYPPQPQPQGYSQSILPFPMHILRMPQQQQQQQQLQQSQQMPYQQQQPQQPPPQQPPPPKRREVPSWLSGK